MGGSGEDGKALWPDYSVKNGWKAGVALHLGLEAGRALHWIGMIPLRTRIEFPCVDIYSTLFNYAPAAVFDGVKMSVS